ncbi:hypothetical protein NDI76_10220 [Halogeometricum sp. S1BR25-6]|uniref:DUF1102 domain-containing protein n=1 Tax=Halogeometricum salsisoli TaxID=2950536 RepID=A0ABU2GFK8_9EURY|nr:hypothetical protein [Halogeometricum sp. S1BR25-6]MDS0299119.1 hypothetical protein [Halogeometricum sp. S1BR25-6]
MRRRSLLVGVATALSGCAAARDAADRIPFTGASSTNESTVVEADEGALGVDGTAEGGSGRARADLPPPSVGTVSQFDPADVFERVSVGAAEQYHHRVVVWNAAPEERELTVRLSDADDDRTVLDVETDFPAYQAFEVRLFDPADYVLAVAADGEGGRRLGVPRSFIDCDGSETVVAVRPGGGVDAAVRSTTVLCDFGG